MRVSVIIPVFNRPRFVLEALNSVLNQTRPADEIIVIDDGSTDETVSALKRFIGSSGAPVRLVSLNHGGASAARNFGLNQMQSDSDMVAFLDSDDLWPTCFLERTTEVMALFPEAVAVSCDQDFWELDSGFNWQLDSKPLERSPWLHMIEHGAGIASCTLFQAAAVRAEHGFPEEIPTGHDCILFALLATRGKWLHAPGAPVIFRRNYESTYPSEDTHLHRAYPDYLARWAAAFEFIYNCAPIEHRADPSMKLGLSRIWREAAQQALANSHQRAASEYFERKRCERHTS